jgi:hypothetical protein
MDDLTDTRHISRLEIGVKMPVAIVTTQNHQEANASWHASLAALHRSLAAKRRHELPRQSQAAATGVPPKAATPVVRGRRG